MEFALEYKVKQSKNGKFSYHYKPAQSILKRPPQKGSLKNVSPGAGLFSEFYSNGYVNFNWSDQMGR